MKYSHEVSLGEWIQTAGGLVGALLAGLIAVWLFRAQVKNERALNRVKELEGYIKSYYLMGEWIRLSLTYMKDIDQTIKDGIASGRNNQLLVKLYWESLNKQTSKMEKINHENIPKDMYEDFVKLLIGTERVIEFLEYQIADYQSGNELLWAEPIKEEIKNYEIAKEKLEEHKIKAEQEIESISRRLKHSF